MSKSDPNRAPASTCSIPPELIIQEIKRQDPPTRHVAEFGNPESALG